MSTVNINLDSEEVISQLPGFDLALARKVVGAREKGIVFTSIDQLAVFLQLKPHIIHKLEGLVSFDYENDFNPSNSNAVKRRTHRARVLDFNENLDNRDSNVNSNINVFDQETTESTVNSDIKVSNPEITNSNVNLDIKELNLNPEIMGEYANSNIDKSNENQETTVSNTNSDMELNVNHDIKRLNLNSKSNNSSEIIRSKVKLEFKICPKCDYQNEMDSKFCVSCGNKLHVGQLNENFKLNICPSCKKENDFDSNFCVFCGTKLSGKNSNNTIKQDSSISNNNTNHKSRRLDF